MKKHLPDRHEPEEHMDPAPAAAQPEEDYSLEEILNEFGGWTQQPAAQADAAPQQPQPKTEAPQQAAPAADAEAPQAGDTPADGDTIRFRPVTEEEAEQAKRPDVWAYRAEPEPKAEPADAREARRIARQEQLERREQQKRQRQLERFQKQEARRARRRAEQPEHSFSSLDEAWSFYARGGTQRLRLSGSLFLCVVSTVMLLLTGSPWLEASFQAQAALLSKLMLGILLLQCALCMDVLASGVQRMLRLRFDHLSMLCLLTLLTLIDSFFAFSEDRISFCTLMGLLLTLGLWASALLHDARRRSLRAVRNMASPVALVREEKAWHGYDCIFRGEADTAAFVRQLELPDAAQRLMRVYAPAAAGVSFALALLSALRQGTGFLWAWTSMLLASFPAGMLLAFARPFHAFSRRLYRLGAAVGGWAGARTLSGEAGLIIEDADLFPEKNVTPGGMKIYSDRPVSQIVGYATAVVQTAGSGLVPLFEALMMEQNGRRVPVDSFKRYEGGGLGAQIRGDVVLMGSLAFMKLMRVQIPEGTKLKQAVYLSINAKLAAVFALNYAAAEDVHRSLTAVLRTGGLVPVLATRDFMITPQFLKQRYKIPPERIEFPIVEERARLSSGSAVRDARQGALMARRSFASFAGTVTGARSMRSACLSAMLIAMAGGILGAGVMFFLTYWGSSLAVSCWNLLLYTALWLLPGLLTGLLFPGR